MDVEEIMTKNPVTVAPDASIREVLTTLHDLDIRHVPVVEDGRLVGFLSDRDLRQAVPFLDEIEAEEIRTSLKRAVSDLMSSDVIQLSPADNVTEAIDVMLEHRIGALPVVAPGTKELVGILSYVDVLTAARDEL